jgi:hypothetical protein
MDAEAALGEIPDEFLDPIQVGFLYLFGKGNIFGGSINCTWKISFMLFFGSAL